MMVEYQKSRRVQEEQPLRPVDDVRVQEEQPLGQKMMIAYKRNNH